MRLLLDTNVLLWTLIGSPRINDVKDLILSVDTEIFVSTASWWEIAIKTSIGKLDADVHMLRAASGQSGFLELPILGIHAEKVAKLPILGGLKYEVQHHSCKVCTCKNKLRISNFSLRTELPLPR